MNSLDEIIELYKRDVDITMIDESLRLTVENRLRNLEEFERFREELVRALVAGGVEFILVGEAAATAHGSPGSTQVVDLVYSRDRSNLQRLVGALSTYSPYLRGAPVGLPFRFDVETLNAGLNFKLVTDLCWIDLLGEVTGGGDYQSLFPHSVPMQAHGLTCRVLDLETLIETKRAAARLRDLETVAELELLRDRAKR